MRFVAFLVCLLLSVPAAPAQGLPGISVSGTAELTKTPEVARLFVKQYARGADHDGAKSSLISAEKKLLTKLGDAGLEIVHSSAGTALPSSHLQSRYTNFQSMLLNRRQMQAFNNNPNPNNPPADKPYVFLERFVSVDVRPKDKQKDVLTVTAELQERLRKDYHDLSGLTDAFPKDEDNNPPNNAAQIQLQMFRNDASYFTQDVRMYVAAKITREDRVKLYGQALKKARSVAEDLAAAAGVRLGELQTLSSNFMTSTQYGNVIMSGSFVPGDSLRFPFFKEDPSFEAVAVRQLYQNAGQPGQSATEPLTYQITLNVSFKIEGK